MEHQPSHPGGLLQDTHQTSKHREAPPISNQAELLQGTVPFLAECEAGQHTLSSLVESSQAPPSFSITIVTRRAIP